MNNFSIGDKVKGKRTGEIFTIDYIKEGVKYKYGHHSGDHETTRHRGKDLELVSNRI